MTPFDYQPRTRIVFGPGRLSELGGLAAELGGRRALIVSDPGVVDAGHAARGARSLEEAGLVVSIFQGVHENPSTDDVDRCLEATRQFGPDVLVGLGGGSSMDCAKGVNFLHTNGGRMQDYWGVGKATQPMLPMIAVPTTAGTGSETQSFALISDARTHVKMACGDPKASFRLALLDPMLTLTQPDRVTALTGIDALVHAVETYVTTRRNPLSLAFSLEAWRLLSSNFSRVIQEPANLDARGAMLLGASFAGLAIEYSMLGAAHALANPLTARFGVAHGQAVGLMLPHVIRFNGQLPQVATWYRELWRNQENAPLVSDEEAPDRLAGRLQELVAQAGLETRLRDCGVDAQASPELADAASKQWTGDFNPRQLTSADLRALYDAAF